MHINELPPELLVRIFSNIDNFSEKIALEKVCKHWNRYVPLDWKATKTCPVPLNDPGILGLVLKRCGQSLEELWFQNMQINKFLVNQMAERIKCLKHLKLSNCQMDWFATDSIEYFLGQHQQLCSFILDGTPYRPYMRRLMENESSKLEHLQIYLDRYYFAGTLPTKLPNNLKSLSLHIWDGFNADSLLFISQVANDCKNLKILHMKLHTIGPDMFEAIGTIKSLVYLNLAVNSIPDQLALQNLICFELPNLKALRIGGYCSKEMISNISRDRPDLVHLDVFTHHAFQIPDSLNSLTLRISMNFGEFLPDLLFQNNKSIQLLDIRSLVLPSSSNFIKKLLGQFPNLKSIHCKRPATNADLISFFFFMKDHLKIGRKITIYLHFGYKSYLSAHYYKYVLPDDLAQFNAGWRSKMSNGKCENLVLKKLVQEAITGGNNPSFLDEYWME